MIRRLHIPTRVEPLLQHARAIVKDSATADLFLRQAGERERDRFADGLRPGQASNGPGVLILKAQILMVHRAHRQPERASKRAVIDALHFVLRLINVVVKFTWWAVV